LRNTIEGLNGLIKDPAHEALAQPARRRVRGIAAQSIFTALLLMAANIRKIRAWRALTARDKTRITQRALGAPFNPARLPPRRLTGTSSPRHPDTSNPAGQPRLKPARSTRNRPAATPGQAGQRPAPVSEPGVILKNRSPPQFCRYDTGSSVDNPLWVTDRTR
jgi:hypothetical protein